MPETNVGAEERNPLNFQHPSVLKRRSRATISESFFKFFPSYLL